MKTAALILILLLGGMVLMNSPPVPDLLTDIDQLEMVQTDDGPVFFVTQFRSAEASFLGGIELKLPLETWTATIYDNQPSVALIIDNRANMFAESYSTGWLNEQRPETHSWRSQPNIMGLTRLDIGERDAIWRCQETYT